MHSGGSMRAIALLITSVVFVVTAVAQSTGNGDASAIRQVIDQQQQAWNRGDLEAFMAGYWNAPEAAFLRGEFHLTMSDGKTPHGLFTLIFRRFPEGWKIVHDHSAGE